MVGQYEVSTMKCGPAANKFGEFIVKNLYDEAIDFFEMLSKGHWKAPGLKALQAQVQALSPGQLDLVRSCIQKAVGAGLHRFLFALGEAYDFKQGIAVMVDGINVVEQSDGLHGESFGPDGWMAKFSKFPDET